VGALALVGLIMACTSAPTTPPAAEKPAAASPSPSPVAQATATTASRLPISGGAAQPRANATFQAPGGNAIVIVPTPALAANTTLTPAPFAPAVALTTAQPVNVPQVQGTLSRIPTAVTGGGGGGGGGGNAAAAAAAAAVTGGGGGGAGIQTIPVVITSTPLTRIQPQPQPAIVYPR
jgi:hypothetical protein